MIEEAPLNSSVVFKALSKPTLLMGVDYNYFLFSVGASLVSFIAADQFKMLLLFLPLHLVGWILCKVDPYIFRILTVKANIGFTRNKSIWQCQSYEAY